MKDEMLIKGFSIIVCCYNSAKLLPDTLNRLALLYIPEGVGVELIVVDNCCTDDTVLVAKEIWKNCGVPFRMNIARENTPGLSFAREKGIRLAKYEYLLFCDDDNHLNKDYLITAINILSTHPQIGTLGGYGEPVYDTYPDFWHKDFFIYGSGPQAKENGKTDHVHGAGVIIRKEAFNRLKKGNFSFILSDRKKDSLSSGGDYELCYAIALAGYEVWYHHDLRFSHYIPPFRTTWKYCKRFIHESAPALDVLEVYHYIIASGSGKGLSRLYLNQCKNWLFHLKKYLSSGYLRLKYHHRKDVLFLEKFHQKYHKQRIICIGKNIFYYRHTYKKITALKKRLADTSSQRKVKMSNNKGN